MIWPEIHSLRSFRQTHWSNIYWLHILAAGQWKHCLMWHWRLYPCPKVVNGFDLGKGGKEAESISKGEFSNMALTRMNSPYGSPPFLTWMSTDKDSSKLESTWPGRNESCFSSLGLLLCHLGKRPYNSCAQFFPGGKSGRFLLQSMHSNSCTQQDCETLQNCSDYFQTKTTVLYVTSECQRK